ncbi:MAG: DUF2283 domain-containing protein [Thermodesulfobacteriota bacterium]
MATTVTARTESFIKGCLNMAADMMRLPARQVWIDYDKEADVLYMSFRKPQRATRTIEADEDILIRKDGRAIVGITVLNVSTRGQDGEVI